MGFSVYLQNQNKHLPYCYLDLDHQWSKKPIARPDPNYMVEDNSIFLGSGDDFDVMEDWKAWVKTLKPIEKK